ncbi:phosphate starvation protein PhoH, partial [Klebsiella pneumoniae]
MGNKRKQARRAARQALKSKSRIVGYEIDTIIVDELASAAPALPPKPKRDTSPIEAPNEAQAHYPTSLDRTALTLATGAAGCRQTSLATAGAPHRL